MSNQKNKTFGDIIYDYFYDRMHSTILCIKYPFLYPRNRFNDLHYSSYKMEELISNTKAKIAKIQNEELNAKENKSNLITIKFRKNFNKIWYKILKFHYYYTLQIFHCIPNYTELDAMELGWRKLFGAQMCQEIKEALLKEGGKKALYEFRIEQIKEKFGGLRFYTNWTTQEISDIIKSYELISYYTCGCCGKNAKWHTSPWIYPLCDDCITNKEKQKATKITGGI